MGPMTRVLLAWKPYTGEHTWVLVFTSATTSAYEEKGNTN